MPGVLRRVSPAGNPCRYRCLLCGSSARTTSPFKVDVAQQSTLLRRSDTKVTVSFPRLPDKPACLLSCPAYIAPSSPSPRPCLPSSPRHDILPKLPVLLLFSLHALTTTVPLFRATSILPPSFSCLRPFCPSYLGLFFLSSGSSAGPRALPAATLVEPPPSVIVRWRLSTTVVGRIPRAPPTSGVHGVRAAGSGGLRRPSSGGAGGIRRLPAPAVGSLRRRSTASGNVWRRRPAVPSVPSGTAACTLNADERRALRRCRRRRCDGPVGDRSARRSALERRGASPR